MVGADAVDGAVRQGGHERVAVDRRPDGRVHLEILVEAREPLVGEEQVERGGFGRDRQALPLRRRPPGATLSAADRCWKCTRGPLCGPGPAAAASGLAPALRSGRRRTAAGRETLLFGRGVADQLEVASEQAPIRLQPVRPAAPIERSTYLRASLRRARGSCSRGGAAAVVRSPAHSAGRAARGRRRRPALPSSAKATTPASASSRISESSSPFRPLLTDPTWPTRTTASRAA